MTYWVTRCRAEKDVTFNGCVTRMVMSRVLSVGSGMPGRCVIMDDSVAVSNAPLRSLTDLAWSEKPHHPATCSMLSGPVMSRKECKPLPAPKAWHPALTVQLVGQ